MKEWKCRVHSLLLTFGQKDWAIEVEFMLNVQLRQAIITTRCCKNGFTSIERGWLGGGLTWDRSGFSFSAMGLGMSN